MAVREATTDEIPAVMTVFASAMLETDIEAVRDAVDRGDVLVAVDDDRVLGACLRLGEEIEAIAVRRQRRGQGIGTTLVDVAAGHRDRLVAEFDERVRPFWESLDFVIEPTDDADRYRGRYDGTQAARNET